MINVFDNPQHTVKPYRKSHFTNGLLTLEYFDGAQWQWSKVPQKVFEDLRKSHAKLEFISKNLLKKKYRLEMIVEPRPTPSVARIKEPDVAFRGAASVVREQEQETL